ncbi:hypothetical protein [Tenacibaculum aestuarii]|uniref:hypothetical protein n=1 Tax=Tenacibaculum aestuarii TaxID=362781 RepID=UPI0038940C47
MKKLLFILTLTISSTLSIAQTNKTLSDAEIKKEWIETINWIKSKSSYYNIEYYDSSWGNTIRVKQSFKIYSDFSFLIVQNEIEKSKKWFHKGSLLDMKGVNTIAENEKDSSVSRIHINVSNERKFATTDFDTYSSTWLEVLNKDDMPKRLENAFNSLGKISSRYRKIINEEKRKKESDRIKSYNEKF